MSLRCNYFVLHLFINSFTICYTSLCAAPKSGSKRQPKFPLLKFGLAASKSENQSDPHYPSVTSQTFLNQLKKKKRVSSVTKIVAAAQLMLQTLVKNQGGRGYTKVAGLEVKHLILIFQIF